MALGGMNPSELVGHFRSPLNGSDSSITCNSSYLSSLIPNPKPALERSEEHTSELQSLMRISYAVFCLKKKKTTQKTPKTTMARIRIKYKGIRRSRYNEI